MHYFKNFLQQKEGQNQWSSSLLDEYIMFLEKKSLSQNSKRRRIQSLRVFFDFLLEKGKIDFNPLKEVTYYKKILRLPQPPTFNEIKDFLKALEGQENVFKKRNITIFQAIYELGLQSKDFQFLLKDNLTSEYLLIDDKNFLRSIPISSSLYFNLSSLIKEDFKYLIYGSQGMKLIDEGLKERSIELIFKDISNKTGIIITPKSLRQACIIKWFKKGINKTTIASYLGVKNPEVLNTYETFIKEDYDEIDVILN